MAGTPSLLRLALLLLGAVGRAGPRPQVSPGDPGDKWEGGRCGVLRGAGASGGAPGLELKLRDPRQGKCKAQGRKRVRS